MRYYQRICSLIAGRHIYASITSIPLPVTGKVRSIYGRSFDLSAIVATLERENISDRTIIIAEVVPLLISLPFHINHLKSISSLIVVDRYKSFMRGNCRMFERQAYGAYSTSIMYSILCILF